MRMHLASTTSISFDIFQTLLAVILLSSTCLATVGPAAPGVAFHLSPNHGTVAVHLQNGPTIPVARLQGSRAYQTFMRRAKRPEPTLPPSESATGFWCSVYNSTVPRLIRMHIGWCVEDYDFDAVHTLLHSLKRAAEKYLGHKICFADIVLLYKDAADGYIAETIGRAHQHVGLTQISETIPETYSRTLMAPGVQDLYDFTTSDHSFLVIDNSAYGMNLDNVWVEDGITTVLHRIYNITGVVSTIPGPGDVSHLLPYLREQQIRETLRDILILPFNESPWGDEPRRISALVLHGDLTEDPVFQEDLMAVFGEELTSQALAAQPMFAPALGGARAAFETLNDISFGRTPKFGCCLRSGGLACPRHEQRIEI